MWYNTGTVNVTQGSVALQGVGTNWISQATGWWVWIRGEDRPQEIRSVDSSTDITLVEEIERASGTGIDYAIIPTQSLNLSLREKLELVFNAFETAQESWDAVFSNFSNSAYQLWLDVGNTGTTADFLEDITGKTAYEIWLEDGNTGTVTDFFNALTNDAAAIALGHAQDAETAQIASEAARDASQTASTDSLTYRTETQVILAAAQAIIDAQAWVSGASYNEGDPVYSLTTGQSYRAIQTHNGRTTDPSLDTAFWVEINTNRLFREKETVAVLKQDNVFTYTPNELGTVVAGDIINTRRHQLAFEVAASGSADIGISTSVGVLLYPVDVVYTEHFDNDIAAAQNWCTINGRKLHVKNDITFSADITINCPVKFVGGKFIVESGVTVTLSKAYESSALSHIFDVSQGGNIRITEKAQVFPDHWGPKALLRSDSTDSINIVKYAFESTYPGSEVCIFGRYVTVPLVLICDEGNPLTATDRDFGKRISSKGGRCLRYNNRSDDVGDQIELVSGANANLLSIVGATRLVGTVPNQQLTGSRCSINVDDNITWKGNKGNQTVGDGVYLEAIKDLSGGFIVESAKELGIHIDDTSPGCNALNISAECHLCDGGNMDLRGAGDTKIVFVISGPTDGDGVKFGSNQQVGHTRIYEAEGYGCEINSEALSIADGIINNSGKSNVILRGNTDGVSIASLTSKNPNTLNNGAVADAAHIQVTGNATGITFSDLTCVNDQGLAEFDLWIGSVVGDNTFNYRTKGGAPLTAHVRSLGGTRDVGNTIIPSKKPTSHVASSGSFTINPNLYSKVNLDLDGNVTFNNPATNSYVGGTEIILDVTTVGGNRLTFSSNFITPFSSNQWDPVAGRYIVKLLTGSAEVVVTQVQELL